jgi:hypothetical protein
VFSVVRPLMTVAGKSAKSLFIAKVTSKLAPDAAARHEHRLTCADLQRKPILMQAYASLFSVTLNSSCSPAACVWEDQIITNGVPQYVLLAGVLGLMAWQRQPKIEHSLLSLGIRDATASEMNSSNSPRLRKDLRLRVTCKRCLLLTASAQSEHG